MVSGTVFSDSVSYALSSSDDQRSSDFRLPGRLTRFEATLGLDPEANVEVEFVVEPGGYLHDLEGVAAEGEEVVGGVDVGLVEESGVEVGEDGFEGGVGWGVVGLGGGGGVGEGGVVDFAVGGEGEFVEDGDVGGDEVGG